MRITWTIVLAPASSPISELIVGVTEVGIAYVSFGDGVSELSAVARRLGANPVTGIATGAVGTDQVVRQLVGRLTEYLAGQRPASPIPVDWSLTSGVQRAVLQTLYNTVQYGETITYGELAVRSSVSGGVSGPGARREASGARAIGSIMGANPVPVVVPCHRVLAADGLGGFGGGLEIKRWLLALEGVLTPSLALDLGGSELGVRSSELG